MKLRLKEKPTEWRNFAWVIGVVVVLIAGGAFRKHQITKLTVGKIALVVAIWDLIAWLAPQWFRRFYRVGMTISFGFGKIMSTLLLTVFFFVVLTPLGMILRLSGRDLLKVKKTVTSSYWSPARKVGSLDQQF